MVEDERFTGCFVEISKETANGEIIKLSKNEFKVVLLLNRLVKLDNVLFYPVLNAEAVELLVDCFRL